MQARILFKPHSTGIAVANKPLAMAIRVLVMSDDLSAAVKKLGELEWLNDSAPSGRRLKWYKKRHDHYLKPSQLRHRRRQSTDRKKKKQRSYPTLDGLAGWHVDDLDLHW